MSDPWAILISVCVVTALSNGWAAWVIWQNHNTIDALIREKDNLVRSRDDLWDSHAASLRRREGRR